MTGRPVFSGRMLWGLIVLTLGVLWTLDNLGQIDASQVLRWWPLLAMFWGILLLSGATGRPSRGAGWIWTAIGGLSILRPLGIASFSVFDLWPILLIVSGAVLFVRAWRDPLSRGESIDSSTRADTSAFMAGSLRKVVLEEFAASYVNAVMAGITLDLRGSHLVNNRGVLDVFAMWGGVELIVPEEWRVVGEITPILGLFQDNTNQPRDPDAPTLVVRGTAIMGGVEVRNDQSKAFRVQTQGGVKKVRVSQGGVVVADIVAGDGGTERP